MLARGTAFVNRNPVTPTLLLLMGAIFITEQYVYAYSPSLFEFVFSGQGKLTPGLLLAPLSHGPLLTHFLPNIGLLLAVGWPLEAHLRQRNFLMFTAVTAYVPTFLQIGYSVVTTGTAGTVGFSGAIYAYPPALLCIRIRNRALSEIGTGGYYALAMTAVIPFITTGQMEFLSPLPGATVTHTVGYLFGMTYGLYHWKEYLTGAV